MLTPDTVVTTASLYKKLPFDPSQDLTPITLAASFPYVLVVRKDLPVTNTAELIALAKSSPGSLNYASAGAGSPFHLAAELFKSIGQVDIVGIPYKGGGPALVDVVSGRVDLAFANLGNVMPLIKAGRLKALAVTTTARSAVASDLPTLEESGVPGYNFAANFAFFAPRGVPKDVVNQIHADIAAVLASADVRARLSSADGAEIVANSPDEFHSLLESEHLKWTRIIKAAGITAD
jgi:tripartite-type tricarboxylate transporter receptor subunit TctC